MSAEGAYILRGNVDVGRLEDLFDVHLEQRDTSTVGGLVSALVERIPRPGEVIEDDGLRFEVLESTDRKVERVRVCRAQPGGPAKEVTV